MLDWLLPDRKSTLERWVERIQEAVERAAGTVDRTTELAAEAAGSVKRLAGGRLEESRKQARAGAGAGREALADRVEAVARRAKEIRERRAVRRRRQIRRARPLRVDVSGDDRITLRGRSPVDVRTSDGAVIRYRYYERPGFLKRFYLHLTGRQVWPR